MADHKQINWRMIKADPNATQRRVIAQGELERVGTDFTITDALAHANDAGLYVLQVVNGQIDGHPVAPAGGARDAANRKYWLRVLKDKWGQPPKVGDTIEWLRSQNLRSRTTGKKITIREIKDLERRGELRTIQDWGSAVINEHNCIVLAFEDALRLLDTRGVHYVSKAPLTGMKAMASEPAKCPDGESRIQHFWLYEEVPPWEVAELTKAHATNKR